MYFHPIISPYPITWYPVKRVSPLWVISVSDIVLDRHKLSLRSSRNMARKSGKNSKAFVPMNFLRWRPDDEDKAAIKGAVWTDSEIEEMLDELFHNGYKLSMTYLSEQAAYAITLINQDGDAEFQNHCITFRHANRHTCWAMLYWFHFDFSEGDWSIVEQGNEFDW